MVPVVHHCTKMNHGSLTEGNQVGRNNSTERYKTDNEQQYPDGICQFNSSGVCVCMWLFSQNSKFLM